VSAQLHPRDGRTNGQTDKETRTASAHQQRPPRSPPSRRVDVAATRTGNRIWCILALKCDIWWHYFNDFPKWPNFVYLSVDPGFLPLFTSKFWWSIAVRSPHRMDAPDRHNGQRDKRTNGRTDGRTDREAPLSLRPSVRSSLRWSLTLRRNKKNAVTAWRFGAPRCPTPWNLISIYLGTYSICQTLTHRFGFETV